MGFGCFCLKPPICAEHKHQNLPFNAFSLLISDLTNNKDGRTWGQDTPDPEDVNFPLKHFHKTFVPSCSQGAIRGCSCTPRHVRLVLTATLSARNRQPRTERVDRFHQTTVEAPTVLERVRSSPATTLRFPQQCEPNHWASQGTDRTAVRFEPHAASE